MSKNPIIFLLYHKQMDGQAGVSAREGLGVIMRQTFYGGYYGLIDENLMPSPVCFTKHLILTQEIVKITAAEQHHIVPLFKTEQYKKHASV